MDLAPAAGMRLDRATITSTIARITEASAVLLAIGYGLGMISLAGDLRMVDLHETSILTGFAHDDVLMKGFGLLISHVPSLLTVLLLFAMALSERSRAYVRLLVAPGRRDDEGSPVTIGRGALIVCRVGLVALIIVTSSLSVWWEGTVVVLGVYAYLTFAWRHSLLLSTGALLATTLLGALLVGFVGAYVHPQPLPRVEIATSGETTVSGDLLGQGQRGDWYVVERADDTTLQLVPDKQVASMRLSSPEDEREPTLYQRVLDR